MVTIRRAVETAEGLAASCTRVPSAGPEVCRCCHGRTRPGYPLCFPCGWVLRRVSRPCERVVPISLYRRGGHLHAVLRRYKDDPDPVRRRLLAAQVAALVARFLWQHGACVAPGGWDFLAVVPSTTGRAGRHPLERALASAPWLAAQLVPALSATGACTDHNAPDESAFAVTAGPAGGPAGELTGFRALLLDDTYTTGARGQSAASALALAGVEVAAIVPVGRVVSPGAAPSVARWWSARRRRWDPASCCASGGDRQLADAHRRVALAQVGDPDQHVAS